MAFDHLGSLSLFSCMLCVHLFLHSFPVPRRVFHKHSIGVSYPHHDNVESLQLLFIVSNGKMLTVNIFTYIFVFEVLKCGTFLFLMFV